MSCFFLSEEWIKRCSDPDNCFTVAKDELLLSGAGLQLKNRLQYQQRRKTNRSRKEGQINHPNGEEGCWASDRHTTAFKKWERVAMTDMRPFLWWTQPPWGPFVSSMHRPSPPRWTVSAVPHARPSSSTRPSFLARFQAVCAIRAVSSLSYSVYDNLCAWAKKDSESEWWSFDAASLLSFKIWTKLDLAVACTKATWAISVIDRSGAALLTCGGISSPCPARDFKVGIGKI